MLSDSLKKQIEKHFSTPLRQYQLEEHANHIIRSTKYKSANSFLTNLQTEGLITSYTLSARNGKTITLYCSHPPDNLSPYEIAKAMFPEGYFCNLSSIYYHSLTNQVPSSIYICNETIATKPKLSYTNKINNTAIRSELIKPHR